jgi:hypothetical protein
MLCVRFLVLKKNRASFVSSCKVASLKHFAPERSASNAVLSKSAMLRAASLFAFIMAGCACKRFLAAPTTSYESSGVHHRPGPYEELEPIMREDWLPNDPQVF